MQIRRFIATTKRGLKIEVYNNKQYWFYDFKINGKRYRGRIAKKTELTIKQAYIKLTEIKTSIQIAQQTKPEFGFEDALKYYFNNYLKLYKPNYVKDYWARCQKILKAFGNSLPEEITSELINEYVYQRLHYDNVKPNTINREISIAISAYNFAIEHEKVKTNPFKKYKKFQVVPRERYLSIHEIKRLLEACKQVDHDLYRQYKTTYLFDVVIIAILTGMRKSNILGLHSKEINFDDNVIIKSGDVTKNKKPLIIPMHDIVREVLLRRLEHSQNGYIFENVLSGKPLKRIDRPFKRALKLANIEDFRFHDLRHTFATYVLSMSSNLRATQELLGHNSIKSTEKYSHVLNKDKIKIINDVGGVIKQLL